MIDLRRLQVLRVVQQTGTVTSAAGALHLTPSAVSQQIRQLSKELGVALLEPQGRGVRLTPAACLLLDRSADLHVAWEKIRGELAAQAEGGAATVRMCGFPTAVASLLAPAAARLRKDGHHVRLTECEARPAIDLLLVDEADLAVFVPTSDGPSLTDARFAQWPLLDEPQDLLIPVDHPLAVRPSVELADAAHEPWINAAEGSCDQHELVQMACASAGFTPDVQHEAASWAAVSSMVAHDLGVALIPRLARVPAEHAVVRLPLHGTPVPTRRILAAVRRGSESQPAIVHALAILRDLAEQISPAR